MTPPILILHASGANRDAEAARACELAGGAPQIVHINRLRAGEVKLNDFAAVLLPGGFSYGDALGAGARLALDLQVYLADQLQAFIESDRPVLGICNGFQTLVKCGLLPGPDKPSTDTAAFDAAPRRVTLTENGATAFAGFYPAGTALDPVSFQFSYGPGELTAGKKKVKVGKKGGEIELAEVECESASCKVKAPNKISARIKGGKSNGKRVNLKVKASKERGGDVDVVAKLKRGDAKLLASGGSLTLKAKVTLKGDGEPLSKKVSVKVVSR